MDKCYACEEASVIVDYSEGTYVCTQCGVVQEHNILWTEYITYDTVEYDYDTCNHEEDSSIPWYIWKESKILFKDIQRDHSYRGNIKKGVYCNCVFKMCNLYNIPRSLKEISEIMDICITLITKTTKHVEKYHPGSTTVTIVEDDFEKMIPRYLNKLEAELIDHLKLTKPIKEFNSYKHVLIGRTPHTKLVTFLYHLMGDIYTKKQICAIFDISIVTLNKSYKQFITDLSNF